jgi:4-diphosphocytidyl-2C-methyl-D-erythritol kinase
MTDEKNVSEDNKNNPTAAAKETGKETSGAQDKEWSLEEVNENSDQNLKNASDRLDQIERELMSGSGKKDD